MKILITNTVVLNTGDAAILEGEMRVLREIFGPGIRIEIYGAQSDVATRYYPELIFLPEIHGRLFKKSTSPTLERILARLQRTSERPAVARFYAGAWLYGLGLRALARLVLPEAQFDALKNYASADLIVSTGGTYLVEHYNLEAKIFDLMTVVLLRKPLVLYTQSLGPFANPKYRKRLRVIFEKALTVLLRDERSQTHVRELGLSRDTSRVTADVAFALADPEKWQHAPRTDGPLRVAVSVREWTNFKQVAVAEGQARYLLSMRELVSHLVRSHRAEVLLISTCQGIPDYWADDSRLAGALLRGLPADVVPHVELDQSFHSPSELIEILGQFDLVISTRMHMAILALDAGAPVLAVAYEFKTAELFRELGQAHLAHDIERITPDAIIRSADEVIANLGGMRDSFQNATLRQRSRVYESGKSLKEAYQTLVAR